jgi:hypothetical protein
VTKQNRSADAQINIRMSAEQRALLERATAVLVKGIPGGRVPLGPWLLELGLAEAKRILGK